MKKKIVLAVVVAAVVLAAAFALHRPQAGTQPTPEPTRQAETNDAVPAEPTPQPAAASAPAHARAIITGAERRRSAHRQCRARRKW